MATNEDKQMVLAFMADEVDVDPVSGNEVPQAHYLKKYEMIFLHVYLKVSM